ncbi:site-specific integrase [Congregibacter variabilis]|uniref:Site-specific integrase n=1 Tax=Congregibacter variabilis TaxID=3081200 RepID=A0ABZ0I811_9GAMM|nr:site-specific integrase [Congregibacter sp. IMCC43200]
MASIRKYRNGWRVDIRRQGHAPMTKTFAKKGEASQWAMETEAALVNGDLSNPSNKTVAEMIQRYKEECDPIPYEKSILKEWDIYLGKVKLNQIRKAHVVDARKRLTVAREKQGKPLAPATINRRVALLSRVCRIAIQEWDWLSDNPCHIRALKEDNQRDRLLSSEEQTRLAEAVANHEEKALLGFVLVAEATGMRAGELVSLKWQNVNTDTGIIEIIKSKNGEKRAVAVVGNALEWLKAWKQENVLRFGGYVFGNETGFAPFYYSKAWVEVKKTAELEDFRFHDLRHSFVTSALKAGMNPVMVQLVSGHKSGQMLKRYAHLVTDVAMQIAEATDAQRNSGGQADDAKE